MYNTTISLFAPSTLISLSNSRITCRQRLVRAGSSFRNIASRLLYDNENTKSILMELYQSEKQVLEAEKKLQVLKAEKQVLEKEKQVLEKEKQVQVLEKEKRILALELELEVEASKRLLQDVKTELAALKNLLNARGMIELAEEEFDKVDPNLRLRPRALKWQEALDMPEFSALRECIVSIRALQVQNSEQAGKAVASLYQELSLRASHGHPTADEWRMSNKVLDIDAAGLAPARGCLVACLASFMSIRYISNEAVPASEDVQG